MRNFAGKKILVTGGAGFIGSALIRQLVRETDITVVNVDKLTYAGHLESLAECLGDARHIFEKADVCDGPAMERIFARHQPGAVVHLAAESHVDRSIDTPAGFVQTNVMGTSTLLEVSTRYFSQCDGDTRAGFVFHHVSTDEVYGSLSTRGKFTEESPYRPNSPYSASKAAADHLVRAWHRTYDLPILLTNCSNNYGPYQYPEKFIPVVILNALEQRPIPVYGDGTNIRDWLYVDDHARALRHVLERGAVGETYNIGGNSEISNLELARRICDLLEHMAPGGTRAYSRLIQFVRDRPGHDQRYAIDSSKLKERLGWKAREDLASGLRKTVEWYLANRTWCEQVTKDVYQRERLGLHRHG